MTNSKVPSVAGFHHFSPTVTDLESSVLWYQRVFGLERVAATFPHYGKEETGYGVLLIDPRSGIAIGLHKHAGNQGEKFSESRTGLDHIALSVASRTDLDTWAQWLDELGVPHSPIADMDEPFAYATLVFRDPDDIQLELFATR